MTIKNRSTSLIILFLFFLSVTVAWLAQQGAVYADNVRVVRLSSNIAQGRSYQIPFNVEPETLVIDEGTVVVWTLFGASRARVLFEDGKRCKEATEAPVGFELESSGKGQACYRGVLIPNGGTASLKFKEKGVFEYTIEWENQPQKTRAKIVVY